MTGKFRTTLAGRFGKAALFLGLVLSIAGCDGYGRGVFGPGGGDYTTLHSGSYDYRAWSDYGSRGPVWWGYLELRVERGGEITGSYELPRQCVDAYGYEVTCYGRVGGRVYRDGTLRFGFGEGWLAHDGSANRRSEVTGRWDSRILGYRDEGTFELIPYRR